MLKYLLLLLTLGCQSITLDEGVSYNKTLIATQSLSEPVNTFYVRVEFLVNGSDIKQYPVIMDGFRRALNKWSEYIPIEALVFVRASGTESNTQIEPRYMIKVKVYDKNNQAIYENHQDILGMWQYTTQTLWLNAEYLCDNAELSYTVALHELGHCFGLNHIVNYGDPQGMMGDMTVSHGAEWFLMYPIVNIIKPPKEFSAIELFLARNYIIGHLTNQTTKNQTGCILR